MSISLAVLAILALPAPGARQMLTIVFQIHARIKDFVTTVPTPIVAIAPLDGSVKTVLPTTTSVQASLATMVRRARHTPTVSHACVLSASPEKRAPMW
jgi:hypothetical protein